MISNFKVLYNLKEEIQNIINKEGVFKVVSKDYLKKNHFVVYRKVIQFKDLFFKDIEMSMSQILYHYLSDLKQLPTCECGRLVEFKYLSKGYRSYCSQLCSVNSKEKKKKGKITCIKKYGTDNPFKSEEIKKQIEETNLGKYGYNRPAKSPYIKSKVKKYFEDTYGKDNPGKVEEFKNKRKKTFLNNYGVDNPRKSEEVKNQIKETLLRKWGVTSAKYLQTTIKRSKIEELVCKHVNGVEFKFDGKNYDFCIGSDVFEIDGDRFHSLKREQLDITQINNILSDLKREKSLEGSKYKLYRVLISSLPKDIGLVTVDFLKEVSYKSNYFVEYNAVILSREYMLRYDKANHSRSLESYSTLVTKFFKIIGNINLPEKEINDRVLKFIEQKKDISFKNIVECEISDIKF